VKGGAFIMDYIKAFEEWLIEKDRSNNTVSCYIRDVKAYGGWLSNFTSDGVQGAAQINLTHFKKFLKGSGDSIITINRKLASINSFYKFLYEKGFTSDLHKVEPFRNKDVREFRGLEDRELWKLRSVIHKSKNQLHICIIELLLQTGVRVSELVNIKLSDIVMTDRKGSLHVIGKGEAKRTIPLNKDARRAIENYLVARGNENSEYLLIGQRGAFNRNAINLILKKYGEKVQVEITPHMCRHTLGYNLIKKNVPITTIQQILAHESLVTTNLYTISPEQDMVNALEGLEW
jgi:integrase/recombinase XerD